MGICGGVPMRILLVEDEKRMAQALCEILRQEKYEVDHYANGLDGFAAIESDIYDIIIIINHIYRDPFFNKNDNYSIYIKVNTWNYRNLINI